MIPLVVVVVAVAPLVEAMAVVPPVEAVAAAPRVVPSLREHFPFEGLVLPGVVPLWVVDR